jgi:2-C-methyl-D-erythritol 4-phosphate cytidylyltransferase
MAVKNYVIIVAGGSGQRMLSETPKQFLNLSGKPVLLYSLEAFVDAIPDINIILVLPEAYIDTWQELLKDHQVDLNHSIVIGGETRSQSVKNGLQLVSGSGLVAVHDGVRPLIEPPVIKRLFAEAGIYGNAIPVVPVSDTARQVDGDQNMLIDRNKLRLVQTPQVFNSDELQNAYHKLGSGSFTDDAAIIEAAGYEVHLCDGDPENIKLTKPIDMLFAEAILRQRNLFKKNEV